MQRHILKDFFRPLFFVFAILFISPLVQGSPATLLVSDDDVDNEDSEAWQRIEIPGLNCPTSSQLVQNNPPSE